MKVLAAFAFLLPIALAQQNLQIPQAHPRIWWNAARLQSARAFYAARPFNPPATDYVGQAFRYVLTGDERAARTAIDWVLRLTFSTSGTSSDEARWYGEQAILIYDWAYDKFTPAERETMLQRWNGYIEALRTKSWGGLTMPQNNYFWGYLRNELLWGIATYHDNPMAGGFLDHALDARWRRTFLPSANSTGRGGVPHEGTQYGRYLLGYSAIPFASAALLGRPLYNESEFFKGSVFYLIYALTPGPTAGRRFELFPANDDQFWRQGTSASGEDYGNFMAVAAMQWNDLPIGSYARRWMDLTSATPSSYVASVLGSGASREFTSLPLDFFAQGPQYLFGRTGWDSQATAYNIQLGPIQGVGHSHDDFGNWQIWRGGRWLSRETAAYNENFPGYANNGRVPGRHSLLHNLVLMNGIGLATPPVNGGAVLRRLESRPTHSYLVANLTACYRNNRVPFPRPERDNPSVVSVEREFLFVRPLETLLILDRLESNQASTTKTFLAHFEQPPGIQDGSHVLAINGNQSLRLTTLLPSNPTYRVVNEAGAIGQYRLEVDSAGSAQSYFLHVLQARETGGQDLATTFSENANAFTIVLTHPVRGSCRIIFGKGMQSNGGGIACSPSSTPPAEVEAFSRGVQTMRITDAGPVWSQPESGTLDTTPPVISDLAVVPHATTAVLTWSTDEPATSQIEFGASAAFGLSTEPTETLQTTHSIELKDLLPATTYFFRAHSRDAAGNLASFPTRTFTTARSVIQFTITATAGPNGIISPEGSVLVEAGASQSFQIVPDPGFRVDSILVDGEPAEIPEEIYTFSDVSADHSIAVTFTEVPEEAEPAVNPAISPKRVPDRSSSSPGRGSGRK